MICPHPGCGLDFGKPVRSFERRGNHRPAYLCPSCSGRIKRKGEQ